LLSLHFQETTIREAYDVSRNVKCRNEETFSVSFHCIIIGNLARRLLWI
jgi:hypothetical protein